jgi:hypothetical protein
MSPFLVGFGIPHEVSIRAPLRSAEGDYTSITITGLTGLRGLVGLTTGGIDASIAQGD